MAPRRPKEQQHRQAPRGEESASGRASPRLGSKPACKSLAAPQPPPPPEERLSTTPAAGLAQSRKDPATPAAQRRPARSPLPPSAGARARLPRALAAGIGVGGGGEGEKRPLQREAASTRAVQGTRLTGEGGLRQTGRKKAHRSSSSSAQPANRSARSPVPRPLCLPACPGRRGWAISLPAVAGPTPPALRLAAERRGGARANPARVRDWRSRDAAGAQTGVAGRAGGGGVFLGRGGGAWEGTRLLPWLAWSFSETDARTSFSLRENEVTAERTPEHPGSVAAAEFSHGSVQQPQMFQLHRSERPPPPVGHGSGEEGQLPAPLLCFTLHFSLSCFLHPNVHCQHSCHSLPFPTRKMWK